MSGFIHIDEVIGISKYCSASTLISPISLRVRSINGVARIFFLGGPVFRDLLRPTRFGGGGVVAEIFQDRHEPGRFRFGGGGGVVAVFFWLRP